MAESYRKFASYLRFKAVLSDSLGHLERAGEFDASGVQRAVWLRIFDRPVIPAADIVSAFDRARKIADAVQSTNLASGVHYVVDDDTPAIAISPTVMNVIPSPFSPSGTSLYFIFSRMPAKAAIASAQPTPEPSP